MTATICSCGHRLAIHEFPYACRGGVSYPDEVVACGCFQLHEYQDIAADREQLEAARAKPVPADGCDCPVDHSEAEAVE